MKDPVHVDLLIHRIQVYSTWMWTSPKLNVRTICSFYTRLSSTFVLPKKLTRVAFYDISIWILMKSGRLVFQGARAGDWSGGGAECVELTQWKGVRKYERRVKELSYQVKAEHTSITSFYISCKWLPCGYKTYEYTVCSVSGWSESMCTSCRPKRTRRTLPDFRIWWTSCSSKWRPTRGSLRNLWVRNVSHKQAPTDNRMQSFFVMKYTGENIHDVTKPDYTDLCSGGAGQHPPVQVQEGSARDGGGSGASRHRRVSGQQAEGQESGARQGKMFFHSIHSGVITLKLQTLTSHCLFALILKGKDEEWASVLMRTQHEESYNMIFVECYKK